MEFDPIEQKKDYLYSAQKIAKKHFRVQNAYASFSCSLLTPKAISYGEHISSGGKRDLSDNEVRKMQYKDELLALRHKYIKQFTEIQNSINKTCGSENECTVLILKYLKGKKMSDISEELKLSTRQCQRIHNDALEHFTPLVDGWQTAEYF